MAIIGIDLGISNSAAAKDACRIMDCAYKLQEYAGVARRKRSEGKATWPGRKQVYRRYARGGLMACDVLTTTTAVQPGEALLVPVMEQGRRLASSPALAGVREHAKAALSRLPLPLRALAPAPTPYPLSVDDSLRLLAAEVDARSLAQDERV